MNKNLQMRKQWDNIVKINPFYGIDASPEFEGEEINEQLFWHKGRQEAERFLKALGLGDTSSSVMVEIGCGLGRMTHYFAERFAHVYAMDVSAEMIKRAKDKWKNLTNVDFILGSGSDLRPIISHSIDLVFSYLVLQHVLDEKIVLNYIRESARVLRCGGTAFMQVRTYTPDKVIDQSVLAKIKSRIPEPIKKQIKRVFFKEKDRPAALTRPPASLEEQFKHNCAVWSGCGVNLYAISEVTKSCNLEVVKADGLNTQYTYFTFRKPD
jgi:ubiquinone/menaquinone biosynthesis C-methylase UbiE